MIRLAILFFAASLTTAMAEELKYSVAVSPDGSTAEIQFPQGAKLTAKELETLVANLAGVRQTMKPEAPADPPVGAAIEATVDPRWWVEPTGGGKAFLILRHSRFGWTGFHIPKAEAKDLGVRLQAISID